MPSSPFAYLYICSETIERRCLQCIRVIPRRSHASGDAESTIRMSSSHRVMTCSQVQVAVTLQVSLSGRETWSSKRSASAIHSLPFLRAAPFFFSPPATRSRGGGRGAPSGGRVSRAVNCFLSSKLQTTRRSFVLIRSRRHAERVDSNDRPGRCLRPGGIARRAPRSPGPNAGPHVSTTVGKQ